MLNEVFCIDPPGLPDSARFLRQQKRSTVRGAVGAAFYCFIIIIILQQHSVRGLKVIFGVVTYFATLKRIPLGADFVAFTRI